MWGGGGGGGCRGKGLGNRLDCAQSASWNAGVGVGMQLVTSRPAGQEVTNDIHNITLLLQLLYNEDASNSALCVQSPDPTPAQ